MTNITVRYGVDRHPKSFDRPPTVAAIRNDAGLKAILGYSDNVNILIGGVAQSDGTTIPDGTEVVVESAANKKA